MIALLPILSALLQYAPLAITLLSEVLKFLGHPGVPVVTDHGTAAGMISGFMFSGPHKKNKK